MLSSSLAISPTELARSDIEGVLSSVTTSSFHSALFDGQTVNSQEVHFG